MELGSRAVTCARGDTLFIELTGLYLIKWSFALTIGA